jgi:hypothetical protein
MRNPFQIILIGTMVLSLSASIIFQEGAPLRPADDRRALQAGDELSEAQAPAGESLRQVISDKQ